MSIRMMTLVWEKSQHKGSELLLLLAISDNANDQGIAYPSVRTLAKKTRLTMRNVQYLIKKIEKSGELIVSTGAGPRGCNEYKIQIPPLQSFQGLKSSDEKQRRLPPEIAIAPEPNTEPKREELFSLSDRDLKRLGLTPGSMVWNALTDLEAPEK